jgi:hypothetical protein
MVYLKDEGSTFDAPIDFVWKYMQSDAHDAGHKTSRNPKFGKVSEITFTYSSERLLRGKWAPDSMRITMFPPLAVAMEWTEGVLAGSKLLYIYSPKGEKTGIDVYGDFHSKTLPDVEIEPTVREFLETEFRDDAPLVRAEYLKEKETARKPC